jgi:hypothetical protein
MRRMAFPSKTLNLAIFIVSCLLITPALADSVSLEQTISARYSVRNWASGSISDVQLLEVLHSAYGVYGDHRSVPLVGNAYSLDLFVANTTGTYRYVPEQNTLIVHDLTVNKETLRPSFGQSFVPDASAVILIIWNQTRMSNQYYASAEAGLVVQNVYLAAVTLNLGTICIGMINSNNLRSTLGLPATMTPLHAMPLSYPASPYSSAAPDYARMTGNLPPVQINTASFTEALNNMLYAQSWSDQSLSTQELSQLLWAAYGYSSTDHRTVPSAMDVYPMKIWFLNTTAAYEFNPQTHSVTLKLEGDKRLEIATALGSPSLANATTIFLVIYNSSPGNDGGAVTYQWPEVEAGAIAQNILLEATAWDLSGNMVSQGLEEWNGAGAASIRNILGLSASLVPLYAVPVGHDGVVPEVYSLIVIAALMVATSIAAAFYVVRSRKRLKESNCTETADKQ